MCGLDVVVHESISTHCPTAALTFFLLRPLTVTAGGVSASYDPPSVASVYDLDRSPSASWSISWPDVGCELDIAHLVGGNRV